MVSFISGDPDRILPRLGRIGGGRIALTDQHFGLGARCRHGCSHRRLLVASGRGGVLVLRNSSALVLCLCTDGKFAPAVVGHSVVRVLM